MPPDDLYLKQSRYKSCTICKSRKPFAEAMDETRKITVADWHRALDQVKVSGHFDREEVIFYGGGLIAFYVCYSCVMKEQRRES